MSVSEQLRIWEADSDEGIRVCYPVMHELRPMYSLEEFLERVRMQRKLGYHLVCLEVSGKPVAVAGYQIRETLVDGRFLHVDDLVALEVERSRGFGAKLLDWLIECAKELDCDSVQLDSAVRRGDAHRFYEREGLSRIAFHFSITTYEGPAPS